MQPTPTIQAPQASAPRRVFIDTQGWAEVFHSAALHHLAAIDFLRQAQAQHWELVTSTLILSELVPLLHSRHFRLSQPQILAIVARIRALPNISVLHVDAQTDQQAWALLAAHPQQPWSHVDATSMVLMRQLGMSEVLTADHLFTHAGFTILL